MGIPYLKCFPAVSLNVGGTVLVIVRAVDPVIIDQWVSGLCCVYSARYPGLSRPYDQFKGMYLRTGLFNIHDDGFVSRHDHICGRKCYHLSEVLKPPQTIIPGELSQPFPELV